MIPAISPDQLQARKSSHQFRQDCIRSVPIRHIRRVDNDREDQSERVDDDMPLASLDLLAAIVTAQPPFSVVFTDWLSMIAAEGVDSRPACTRTCSRKAS